MDIEDDDIHMYDIPANSLSRTLIPASREDVRPIPTPRHPNPSLSGRSSIPNGSPNPRLSLKPFEDREGSNQPTSLNGNSSRETSVLAQTTSHLSIDQAQPTQEKLDAFLSDLELEDTDPVEPYRSELPTGFCYDVRMRYHAELAPPEDRRDYHPEDPRRIFSIYRELCAAGLIYDKVLTTSALVSKSLRQIDVRKVLESEVELVHEKRHYDTMSATKVLSADDLINLGHSLDSVYLSGATFDCALLSAGGAIETARAVAHGLVKNAIAIIRPPGHHAECNRAMGFCIFDNVSIATKVCQIDFQETCKKVLILDWDVHHGNGIQQAFYQDPNVLYISIHVHEDGNFYPSGPAGDHTHIGAGPGLGRNINIPWPTKGMGDADYIFAFQQVVMPIAFEFNPDLVMIAAGFDAADGDQLGGCFVSPACYAHMTHMLKSLANGKVVACLEGGYNLRSIARSALAVTRTLNGEVPPRMDNRKPTAAAIRTVQTVRETLSEYYDSIYPKHPAQATNSETGLSSPDSSYSLSQVTQTFFAEKMKRIHHMLSIPVYDPETKQTLDDHILVTQNYAKNVPLLIMMHDPHEANAICDPVTGDMNMNSTTIASGASLYRDIAVSMGWAIVDVTAPNGSLMWQSVNLADKIWEEIVLHGEYPRVFFLSVGNAYKGTISLMNTRETFWDRVNGTIAIIPSLPPGVSSPHLAPGVPVLAAKPLNDDDSIKTYRQRSLNFVGKWHSFWDGQKEKKRKYGTVLRSPEAGVQPMLDAHVDQVMAWIAARCGGDMRVS